MKQTQNSLALNERDLSVLRIHPLFKGLKPDRFERTGSVSAFMVTQGNQYPNNYPRLQ